MFVVDLTGQVSIYGQEECIWCGAACGQMILNGYPPPNPSIFFLQEDVWNAIQARNAEPAYWATDPTGLRLTLGDLNPPIGGSWNDFNNVNRDTVMHSILYWMATNSYPVATLINSGGHWVTIVGYETDIDPRPGSATLDEITYYDPEPHDVGSQHTVTYAGWLAGPWNGSIIYGTIWHGKYVAIIEPPPEPGKVKVGERIPVTGTIISPEQAIKAALNHIKKRGLAKRKEYAALRLELFTPFEEPYLVSVDPRPVKEPIKGPLRLPKSAPRFYIVPFGFEHERERQEERLARIAVIVNAYRGGFVGITAFGKPVRFLSEEKAILIALRALKLRPTVRRRIKTRLVFRPSGQTHLPSYPFWEVTIGTKVLFVDQAGIVSQHVIPSVPGD